MATTNSRNALTGLRDYSVTSGSTTYLGAGIFGSAFVSGANASGTAAGLILSAGGGTINGGYAVDSAYLAAVNGAAVSGGYAGSGASIDAMNQGYTHGATAGSSGAIAAGSIIGPPVNGAGTAFDPRVLSGGYALTGGAPNLVVKGYKVQGSGGLLSGGTFDSGSQTIIGIGGTAIGGTTSGLQWVQSAGQVSGGIFTGSGATQINNGGLTSQSTAISGGLVQVSGASGVGLTAMQGGTLSVTGGTYQGILDNGLGGSPLIGAYTSGFVSGDIVRSGGTEVVGSDGQTTSSQITSGGQGTILNGGTAIGVNVTGGTEFVSAGGLITTGTATGGGTISLLSKGTANSLLATANGTALNNGGSVANAVTITRNGFADTYNGGTTNNYLLSGGTAMAHDGGLVNNFSITGGTGGISNGGTANTITINGGIGNIYQGGIAGNLNLSGGVGEVFQGGSVTSYNVNGGTALVDSGGYANTFTAGPSYNGSAIVQAGAIVNTLSAFGNGTAVLASGASVTSAITAADSSDIYGGGTLLINGTVGTVSGSDQGLIQVSSAANVSSFAVNGATAYLYGGSFTTPPTVMGSGGSMMVESGANLSNLSASNYGTAVLDSGSLTQTATGGANGTVIANSGAQGSSIILSGGQGTVLKGANFSSMNILAGGNGIASNGAALDWMYISSGNGTLQSGATVRHLRIQPGGSGFLMSGASALDISVASGGWVSGAVVAAGNSMSVASAGTAINTIVTDSSANAGANPTGILSGGSAINTVIAGANPTGGTNALGGLLTIQSGANLSNTSMGYNARLRILGLQYDNGGTAYLSGGTLHVVENGQEWTTTLQGSYHGKNASDSGFILLDDGQGNTIVAYDQCFLAGTLIRLEQGDVAIEEIKEGDVVRVFNNGQEELREITSVMKRHARVHTDLPKDMAGWSIKIDQDAFAQGVPSQDLSVTPEHCFYFDGRFVPARMLVNHQTIRYDLTQPEYDFYHIETQPHSVIWANNTLTESYLDTGERPHIENAEDGISRIRPSRRLTWTEDAAAPLDVTQGFVEPLFKQFQKRATELGHPAQTPINEHDLSDDPDLRLQLDNGMIVQPTRRVGDRVLFSFPASEQQTVRLLSRRFKPSESIGPFVDDRRTLGVLVGSIDLWTGGHEDAITEHLTNQELTGWDVLEAGPHRWTRGNAILPLPKRQVATGEMRMLSVQIQAGGPYVLSTADTMQEIAAS